MAKKVRTKKNIKTAKKTYGSPFTIYWKKENYLFITIGFALLIAGYYLMSLGDWDSSSALFFSPIILIIAYLLVFPASILFRKKEDSEKPEQESKSIQS